MNAIRDNDFKTIEKLQADKMLDKKFINDYLGEDMFEKEEVDPNILNRDYNSPQLDKSAYQEFWQGVSFQKQPIPSESRGSRSAMRNVNMSPLGQQQTRNVGTPNHTLPSIHQRRNSVKEPSVHTLEEDDYFGGSPLKKRVKEKPLFAQVPPKRQAEKEEEEPAPDTKNMNAQELSIAQQIKEQKMQLEFEKQKQQTDKALREKKGL